MGEHVERSGGDVSEVGEESTSEEGRAGGHTWEQLV